MTIDERGVTTALRTYARDIELTEADLDRLETRLTERAHPTPRRDRGRRPWEWAVAACAVVALVLAVTALWRTRAEETMPATPGPAVVTKADLAGVWHVGLADSDGHLWHFSSDGRRDTTSTAEEYLDLRGMEPYTLGPGNVLSFSANGMCRSTVTLDGEGRMWLLPLAHPDNCGQFADGVTWPLTRVSPASPAGAAMVRSPNSMVREQGSQPLSMSGLIGTWMLQGTGKLLVVAPDSAERGQYVLDDDGDGTVDPDQRGTVTVGTDASVVLRPSEAEACPTVFFAPGKTTGGTLVLDWADNSCGAKAVPEGTWIRLN